MKNIAVICEYNPFHKGHEEQVRIIRGMFGDDCRIIALMSGNVVQRGEIAVYEKYKRAEAAVLCGASLVLEIPYPYSGSCAEIFASAGAVMAGELGKIDYLVFGSECGDIELLKRIAGRLSSPCFEEAMARHRCLHPECSYPKRRGECYLELYGEELTVTPNDTLGIEYITAIDTLGLDIEAVTYKRQPGYSAGETRKACLSGDDASAFIPQAALDVFLKERAIDTWGDFGRTLLCFCQMKPREFFEGVFDVCPELAGKIKKNAMQAKNIKDLIDATVSPRFTRARVKRALLYSYAGVMKKPFPRPRFTSLLAADDSGIAFLSEIKKSARITVITKPSSYTEFSRELQEDYLLSAKGDVMFCQAHNPPLPIDEIFRKKPFILKRKNKQI